MWTVLVGEVEIGRLTACSTEGDVTRCSFERIGAYERYAAAFADGEIWHAADDALDAVIDEIAVEGVFLVGDDGSEIVDPELRIEGTEGWFRRQSSPST